MATNSDAAAISNPFDDHLGYQLRRASNLVMTMLADGLAVLRLTIVETSVLVLIDRNPGIFQSEIGRVLGIKRANVAPIAAALDRRELVRRTSPEGRLVGLSTTATGAQLAARAVVIMQENDRRLFERLDPDQREALSDGLAAVWRSAN